MNDSAKAVTQWPAPKTLTGPIKTLFKLSFRMLFFSKKTIFLSLFSLMPLVIAVIFQIKTAVFGAGPTGGTAIFNGMVWHLYLKLLAPLFMLFFGSGLIREELENKTLTYLTTRPVPKWAILLGKFLGLLLVTNLLLQTSLFLTFGVFKLDSMRFFLRDFDVYLMDAYLVFLATLAYGAFFTGLGTQFKRVALFGFFFIFIWEMVLDFLPGDFKRITIIHYIRSMLPKKGFSGLQSLFEDSDPMYVCIPVLLTITVVFLGFACWRFTHREYLMSEDSD